MPILPVESTISRISPSPTCSDVNLAEIARDVQEIRAIERALKRIALGTYGVCVSCGQPIERERLEAYPTANRCAACQRAYEHDHASTPTPRL